MLKIKIEETELFDGEKEEFVTIKSQELVLEHSLISISKWEAKWEKPFLSKIKDKTYEESLDYIRCMIVNQNIDPNITLALNDDVIEQILKYISAPMTATALSDKGTGGGRVLTSEVIYSKMVSLGIPFECEKWHLNRLLMLINVCILEQNPKKKMSSADVLRKNHALNEQRRAALGTRG